MAPKCGVKLQVENAPRTKLEPEEEEEDAQRQTTDDERVPHHSRALCASPFHQPIHICKKPTPKTQDHYSTAAQPATMNFTPFGGPFSGTIPGITQFTSAAPTLVSSTPVSTVQDTSNRYTTSTINMTHFNQPLTATATSISSKFRPEDINNDKYNGHLTVASSGQQQYTAIPYSQPAVEEKRLVSATITYPQNTIATTASAAHVQTQPQEISQDLCNAILQQQNVDTKRVLQNTTWQTLTPGSSVADYLSHLPTSTLPLSLHHFLKYSAENIKKEAQNVVQAGQATLGLNAISTTITVPQHQQPHQVQQQQAQASQLNTSANSASATNTTATTSTGTKKKKRKKPPKDRKPRPKPGEIRLTTALDGSPLYMCPECQVAYPEPGLLEIHLVGHNLERRFICDICNAALKRKDHLTRHKQSHNPDRPFICTVCLKAFKRKEQLSLHFVIHSGEKRHICVECGKGFYRKDHLRKHTRSHIARKVKAELSMQQNGGSASGQPQQQQQQQPQTNGQQNIQQQMHHQQLQQNGGQQHQQQQNLMN